MISSSLWMFPWNQMIQLFCRRSWSRMLTEVMLFLVTRFGDSKTLSWFRAAGFAETDFSFYLVALWKRDNKCAPKFKIRIRTNDSNRQKYIFKLSKKNAGRPTAFRHQTFLIFFYCLVVSSWVAADLSFFPSTESLPIDSSFGCRLKPTVARTWRFWPI